MAANPATGALPPVTITIPPNPPTTVSLDNGFANVFWPGGATTPVPPVKPYLGQGTGGTDNRQHPYYRSEMLQKVMNLTTVRTHQYAVWITIGFFEVKRQGDLGMAFSGSPTLAYDILGPEVGASTGQTTRFRSFFIVDRLKLTAFDPNVVGSFRPAVVYRQNIE
jgi:hypothetical protein